MAEKAKHEVGFAKQEVGRISETKRRRAKRTKIWTLWAINTSYICQIYGQKSQTGSWVVSRKQCIVDQNGQKFGPSGLYIQHTYAKYGQKSRTRSWFHETGSWGMGVLEQHGQKFGPSESQNPQAGSFGYSRVQNRSTEQQGLWASKLLCSWP